jgi:hypothetical protein
MKKIILSLLLAAASVFALDVHGFRDIKFGDPVSKDMVFKSLDKSTNVSHYFIIHDKMYIDNERVESIDYAYFNGKFYQVDITAAADSIQKINANFLSQYGKAFSFNDTGGFAWSDDHTMIVLTYEDRNILIFDTDIENLKNEYFKENLN